MKLFISIFFVFTLQAQTNEDYLQDWTKKNEAKLIKDSTIIESIWFEDTCLKLAQQLNFKQLNQCKILNSNEINAYVFINGHVYFTYSMLKDFNNKHQLVAVLAHENAHIVLNHYLKMLEKMKKPGVFFPKRRIKKMLKKHELEADDFALKTLNEFSFDYSQIYYFLSRVKKVTGKHKNNSHIKLSLRINKTSNEEIIDNDFITKIKTIL